MISRELPSGTYFEPAPLRSLYYDRDGQPLTLEQWCRKAEDRAYKRVEYTEIGSGFVSTVWLGLDHSYGAGPLQIFETMVFAEVDRFGTDEGMMRYATEAEAREGHAAICQLYRDYLDQNGGGSPLVQPDAGEIEQ